MSFRIALTIGLTLASTAAAQTKIEFWDFFSGGDGARMKAIVDSFNASQNEVVVNRTTLEWGVPFYTKVHTGVVSGQTPDVMSYHLSRVPAGILAKDLRPISAQELASAGLRTSDFQPALVNLLRQHARTYAQNDALYAVPLDNLTLVVYYNKDLLRKAGLLGRDGKPRGVNTLNDFTRVLQQLKGQAGVQPAVIGSNNDPGSVWRLWYTLFLQQGGKLVVGGKLSLTDLDTKGKRALQTMVDWTQNGLLSRNTTYGASVALFTAGRSGFMVNGAWEVPTLVDLQKQQKLGFDYGVMSFPRLFASQQTWADSHNLAIPASKTPMSPEKLNATLRFIAYVQKSGGLTWAGGGHVPAYLPTQRSATFQGLKPNVEYSVTSARNAVLEPTLPMFGVAGPVQDAVANALIPALTGQLTVDQALTRFKAALQRAAQE